MELIKRELLLSPLFSENVLDATYKEVNAETRSQFDKKISDPRLSFTEFPRGWAFLRATTDIHIINKLLSHRNCVFDEDFFKMMWDRSPHVLTIIYTLEHAKFTLNMFRPKLVFLLEGKLINTCKYILSTLHKCDILLTVIKHAPSLIPLCMKNKHYTPYLGYNYDYIKAAMDCNINGDMFAHIISITPTHLLNTVMVSVFLEKQQYVHVDYILAVRPDLLEDVLQILFLTSNKCMHAHAETYIKRLPRGQQIYFARIAYFLALEHDHANVSTYAELAGIDILFH